MVVASLFKTSFFSLSSSGRFGGYHAAAEAASGEILRPDLMGNSFPVPDLAAPKYLQMRKKGP